MVDLTIRKGIYNCQTSLKLLTEKITIEQEKWAKYTTKRSICNYILIYSEKEDEIDVVIPDYLREAFELSVKQS